MAKLGFLKNGVADYLMIWGNAYKKAEIDSIYVDTEFKYPLIARYFGYCLLGIFAATYYYLYHSYPQLRVFVILSSICCIFPYQSIVRKVYRLNLGLKQGRTELIKSDNKEMIYSMRDDLIRTIQGELLPEYFKK